MMKMLAIIIQMIKAITMAITMIQIKNKIQTISTLQMMIKILKNTMKIMREEREKAAISHQEIKNLINLKKYQMKENQMIMMIIENTIILLTTKEKKIVLTKIAIGLIEGIIILKLSLKYLLLKSIEKLKKKIFKKNFRNLGRSSTFSGRSSMLL